MVQSRAKTVPEYLRELPPDRREPLGRLRDLVRKTLPEFTEGMEYGMPYYRGPDGLGIAFASQRQYIAVYLDPKVVRRHRTELARYDVGKSCVRIASAEMIDWDLLERLLAESRGGD